MQLKSKRRLLAGLREVLREVVAERARLVVVAIDILPSPTPGSSFSVHASQ